MAGNFPLTKDTAPSVEAASMKSAKKMVPMEFPGPADVRLATQDNKVLVFKPGVQMVPVELANHTWLKAHKAKLIEGLAGEQAVATAQVQAQADDDAAKKKEEEDAKKKADADKKARDQAAQALQSMTKKELAVYAQQNHGLELDHEDMKKDEMVLAIQDAIVKKGADADAAGTGQQPGSN